jgi:adenosine deaminase
MNVDDYLRLMPKTELHCHFTSTMSAGRLIQLADKYGVDLPTTDPVALFDYQDLADFLVAFRAATAVLRDPAEIAQVAYDGVRADVATGSLRYREYYLNPQYFAANGLGYTQLLDGVLDGLRSAQQDLGAGFRVVVAINRRESPAAAVELVETMLAHPYPEVVGLGQDDLTPEGTEDPTRFAQSYALARSHGLQTTAHAGERPVDSPDNVAAAIEELKVDRIDHGYRIVDDPVLTARAKALGIHFATTPWSTTICSGWSIDPSHRIRAMIDAGLSVSVSSDDATFFRTSIAREYREALPALGLGLDDAKRISLAGIDGAFCDDAQKASLRTTFAAEFLALDTALSDDPT